MDYHLERQIAFKPGEPGQGLYSWSIVEANGDGRQLGPDFIPWEWSCCFEGTSCRLGSSLTVKAPGDSSDGQHSAGTAAAVRRAISVELIPSSSLGEKISDPPVYSMFGTGRAIENFQLSIYPFSNDKTPESCRVSGFVSYSTEIDFTVTEEPDYLEFQFLVTPERFSEYEALVLRGAVDRISLRVSGVPGFYARWTPGLSTDLVKVLTTSDMHPLSSVVGVPEPPRIGPITEATLTFSRGVDLGKSGIR